MDYPAIKIEAAKAAYVGMTPEQKANAINAGVQTITQDIPTDLAKMAFINTSALDWGEMLLVANGTIAPPSDRPAKQKRCMTISALFDTQSPLEVGIDNPRQTAGEVATATSLWAMITTTMTALVADAILSAAGKTAFDALRVLNRPLWMKFGTRTLDYNDILIAQATV